MSAFSGNNEQQSNSRMLHSLSRSRSRSRWLGRHGDGLGRGVMSRARLWIGLGFSSCILYAFVIREGGREIGGCCCCGATGMNVLSAVAFPVASGTRFNVECSRSSVDGKDEQVEALTWGCALEMLKNSATAPELADELTRTIASDPHDALYFECSPVSSKSLAESLFEFVLMDAPQLLSMSPQPNAFDEHPPEGQSLVRSFKNLGRDATLVSPCFLSGSALEEYIHIASFCRMKGTEARRQALQLWSLSAAELERSLRAAAPETRFWLSTSGTGIGWLHVRIDSQPKYYTYQPYRHKSSY
jgi:hypothetical protein